MQQTEIDRRIKEARSYIDDLLDEEAEADEDIKSRIRSAVRRIVVISLGYNILGKYFRFSSDKRLENAVDDILDELKDSIAGITRERVMKSKTLAEYRDGSEADEVAVVLFVFGKLEKYTFNERMYMYTRQLGMEVEAAIASGLYKGMNRIQILRRIMTHLDAPYLNPDIQEAIRAGGFAASRIKTKGITYGKGRYISGFANLKRMEIMAIAQAYNFTNYLLWKSGRNIIGFWQFRNSSYPCALCDDEVGFHKLEDLTLPVHPNCVCGAFPLYKGEI